ncbi:hypothetical protein HPB48_005187 [Haemaphysalis longicornis]|uniref:Uncharacterized protein n=1 Tax=Haemaphysalis longicornis TaxID=44386 RepID=A0A9J6FIF1_HAELO|nr:hypothetical protein HPB48_005187 [Haemaphysalis longicornis]
MRSDTIDLATRSLVVDSRKCPQREGQGQVHCPHQTTLSDFQKPEFLCASAARGSSSGSMTP